MTAKPEPTLATIMSHPLRKPHRQPPFRFSAFGLRVSVFAAALATVFSLLLIPPRLSAQPASPRIGYIYPAGGRQGAVFQVAVGGQYLNNAKDAYISGPGVKAVVLDYSRPMTQKEFNDLRDKLKEMQQQRTAAFRRGRRGQGGSQAGTNAGVDGCGR